MSTKKVSFKEMKEAVTRLLAAQRGVSVDDPSTIAMVDNMARENLEMFYDRYCGVNQETGREIIERVKAAAAQVKKAKEVSRRKKEKTALEVAHEIIEAYGKPLVTDENGTLALSYEKGWFNCGGDLEELVLKSQGFKDTKVLEAIGILTRLGNEEEKKSTIFFQREAGATSRWEPVDLKANQVVFVNGVLTIRASDAEGDYAPTPGNKGHTFKPFDGKTPPIYGPMITIPFTHNLMHELDETNEDEMLFANSVTSALPDGIERELFQKSSGNVLQPHVLSRHINVLLGVPHSGKTSLVTAIGNAPAGARGFVKTEEKGLAENRFRSIMLYQKFVFFSDDSDKSPRSEAMHKQMTSGSMTYEGKGSKPFTAAITCKLFIAGNELTQVVDPSGALADRLRIFSFNTRLPESTKADKNKYMGEAFWSQEARRVGVLKWLLQGVQKELSEGTVTPEFMKNRVKAAIIEECPYRDFLINNVTYTGNEDDFVFSGDLLASIRQATGLRMSAKALANFMANVFEGCQSTQKTSGGRKGLRGFKGYKMLSNID